MDEIRQQAMITEAQILVMALAAEAALAVSRCGRASSCGGGKGKNSFAAGTLIATKDGPKPIEDVTAGLRVKAVNDRTGAVSERKVVERSMRYEVRGAVKLTLERSGPQDSSRMSLAGPRLVSETVTVTANHPYLMEDGSWRGAGQLKDGDRIRGALGPLTVKTVTFDPTPLWVHNFEVEEDHTYAAGELEAWVHNTKGGKQRIKDSGLAGVSDEEIVKMLETACGKQKIRLQKEQKARGNRNKRKRGKGGHGPMSK